MSLEKIKTIADLASFFYLKKKEITGIVPDECYRVFKIPKPGTDEKRTIETPVGRLKEILERLSDELQWLYYAHKTDAAYGYVRSPDTDIDKRNIYTNARKHLDMNYLVNMDFDNFFHQIDTTKVRNVFSDYNLFSFKTETISLLVSLVTFNGRLPMGSSTSPPLSNFATIGLDNDLLKWCSGNNINFSRYVDDLSFSSKKPISGKHYDEITEIMLSHRFAIDPAKTKWYGKKDTKIITGLNVGKNITIPDEFISEFEECISKIRDMHAFTHQFPDSNVFEWIDKMNGVMRGRLAFVRSIYGKTHPVFLNLQKQLDRIYEHDTIVQSMSWRYAGYEYH